MIFFSVSVWQNSWSFDEISNFFPTTGWGNWFFFLAADCWNSQYFSASDWWNFIFYVNSFDEIHNFSSVIIWLNSQFFLWLIDKICGFLWPIDKLILQTCAKKNLNKVCRRITVMGKNFQEDSIFYYMKFSYFVHDSCCFKPCTFFIWISSSK